MPYMLSATGEVRFIRQDLVETMRKMGWSFTIAKETSVRSAASIAQPSGTGGTGVTGGVGFDLEQGIQGSARPTQVTNIPEEYLWVDTILWTDPQGDKWTWQELMDFSGSNTTGLDPEGGSFDADLGYFPLIPTNLKQDYVGSSNHKALVRILDRYASGSLRGTEGEGLVINDPSGGGGGGGGSRGPSRAAYRMPDRDAITEMVRTYVVAVLGEDNGGAVNQGVDAYFKAHRADYDQPNQDVDPQQAVKGSVRANQTYKDIHSLRPEGIDELQWVTSTQAKLRSIGYSSAGAEQLGIKLATVAASDSAVLAAGESAQFADTSRLAQGQKQTLKSKISDAMGLV